jgi:hypothetical protein
LNARLPGLQPSAALAGAPLPPCLIVNPLSFNASRGLATQASELAAAHGAEVVSIDSPAALTAAIDTVLARRQQHLIVLAGDGTVRAIVDQLACLPEGTWVPDLLVLPGGRTNLTAADLMPGAGALPMLKLGLQRASAQGWEATLTRRATLRIDQSPAPSRYGFWMGAALIDSVIRRTHAYRTGGDGALQVGPLSTPLSLLNLALRALVGRSGLHCPTLQLDAGRTGRLQGAVSLLLATTLQHRVGLFDPYVSRGDGSLRVTAVARRATRFWRSLPRLLTGRFSVAMNVDNGYLSGSAERVEITGLAGYSLDGEAFDTDPARPVLLTRGPSLRFFIP